MKPLEIKGARTRLGYTQQYMADRLNSHILGHIQEEGEGSH